MGKLTKTMEQLLKTADLSLGVVDDVPLSTAYALEARRLVTSDWHKGGSQTTQGGDFPRLHGVKLTPLGVQTARELRGRVSPR